MVRLGFLVKLHRDIIEPEDGCDRRYRRWIVADLQRIVNKKTKAERVLALLVESGVFYIFSGSVLVASTFIRLPGSHIMLGNQYSQATVHLAGIYPLIVVILVSREASMDKTLFNSTIPVIITDLQQASAQFAPHQVKTPMTGPQIADAQGQRPTRGSLDPSFLQDSLASNPVPDPGVDPAIRSNQGGSAE